jgi:TRAP-type C4-dicarboxylate transport system substrate-binding protein
MKRMTTLAVLIYLFSGSAAVCATELSLAYFMGPKHPMNKGVMTPFGDRLAELSGGTLTIKQFPGGALNSTPPKQYAIMLDGVADVVFTLPGYTADVFPKTNVVGLPGVCNTAVECTLGMQRARAVLEKEYNAKVIALWANAPPVLITRDKAVRSLEDMQGLKVRVTSKSDIPIVEALGGSAVAQPVSVVNQNLANGVVDAVMIDPSAIGSFKLYEPGKHVTTWFPGSGSSFALLMNKSVYNGLSDEEKNWVDAASDASLAESAAKAYDAAGTRGLKLAADAGLEMIELSTDEVARFEASVAEAMADIVAQPVGDGMTVGDIIKLMQGN